MIASKKPAGRKTGPKKGGRGGGKKPKRAIEHVVIIVSPPRYGWPVGGQLFDLPSLPMSLKKAGLKWGTSGGYAFDFIKALRAKRKFASGQFRQDAAAGKLPTVSWVYAPHGASEHP